MTTAAASVQLTRKVGCLVFALCCHHLCELDVVCGRQVLEDHGITMVCFLHALFSLLKVL
jgi:hypothetical protein